MSHLEHQERRRRVADELRERKLDGFIVSSLYNIRYLTGFTGSNGLLLVDGGSAVLLTDPRYEIQAAGQTDCAVRVIHGPLAPQAVAIAKRRRWKDAGFEKTHLRYSEYEQFKELLPLGITLVPVAGIVERLRMVKSEDEIGCIRRSVLTNSGAYERTLRKIRNGIRESEVAAELEFQMRRLGAEKPAFETIVAFGERTALPHAEPTGNRLGANQLVLIDMGASQAGYASDMTRVVFLGRPPARTRQMYRAVLEAQLAAIAAVRENVPASSVDAMARRVLRKEKLDKAFVHSTGHGLGLEIHEPPRIGSKEKTRLQSGMVITIEPGVYIEGYGGVRIEDTVLVTRNGCEVLTPNRKELVAL